jgi:anti-sigma B factor antagonist
LTPMPRIEIETIDDIPVVRLSGEVDKSNVDALAETLLALLPNSVFGLVIDLCEAEYLDSSALRLLFDLATRLRRRQQSLRLVVEPDSFVAEVFAAVAIEKVTTLHDTVEDAVEALGSLSSDGPQSVQ